MNDDQQRDLWQRLVAEFPGDGSSSAARQAFFQPGIDRIKLLKQALQVKPALPGTSRKELCLAISLLRQMDVPERQQLFPELIQRARSAHGPVGAVRELILSLPRDWVLARIDQEVEPILQGEEYDDYWMFLELFEQLDPDRARALASRAAAHADPDIRELGIDKLADLPQPVSDGARNGARPDKSPAAIDEPRS